MLDRSAGVGASGGTPLAYARPREARPHAPTPPQRDRRRPLTRVARAARGAWPGRGAYNSRPGCEFIVNSDGPFFLFWFGGQIKAGTGGGSVCGESTFFSPFLTLSFLFFFSHLVWSDVNPHARPLFFYA